MAPSRQGSVWTCMDCLWCRQKQHGPDAYRATLLCGSSCSLRGCSCAWSQFSLAPWQPVIFHTDLHDTYCIANRGIGVVGIAVHPSVALPASFKPCKMQHSAFWHNVSIEFQNPDCPQLRTVQSRCTRHIYQADRQGSSTSLIGCSTHCSCSSERPRRVTEFTCIALELIWIQVLSGEGLPWSLDCSTHVGC